MMQAERIGDKVGNSRIAKVASAGSAVEELFNLARIELSDQCPLVREQVRPCLFCGSQDSLALHHSFYNLSRQGIREAKGDEVKACVLFPMRHASVPDSCLAEARTDGALDGCPSGLGARALRGFHDYFLCLSLKQKM